MAEKPEPAIFTSAFRSSDCHGAPFWRFCWRRPRPDRFVCQRCCQECSPVEDPGPCV